MNVVDSSAWIEFFIGGPNAGIFEEPITDLETLIVPAICLLEVFRFVLRASDETSALGVIAGMRQGRVVDLDGDLALVAAKYGIDHGLPLADSVIYATARTAGAEVWTQDADFEGLPGVRYVAHETRR